MLNNLRDIHFPILPRLCYYVLFLHCFFPQQAWGRSPLFLPDCLCIFIVWLMKLSKRQCLARVMRRDKGDNLSQSHLQLLVKSDWMNVCEFCVQICMMETSGARFYLNLHNFCEEQLQSLSHCWIICCQSYLNCSIWTSKYFLLHCLWTLAHWILNVKY